MLALNRVLFDMIGPVSKQISRDSNLRRDIVNYHLYQRYFVFLKRYLEVYILYSSLQLGLYRNFN